MNFAASDSQGLSIEKHVIRSGRKGLLREGRGRWGETGETGSCRCAQPSRCTYSRPTCPDTASTFPEHLAQPSPQTIQISASMDKFQAFGKNVSYAFLVQRVLCYHGELMDPLVPQSPHSSGVHSRWQRSSLVRGSKRYGSRFHCPATAG